MKRLISPAIGLLMIVTVAGAEWPEKGSVVYTQFEMLRYVSDTELGMTSIPLDRLKADTTRSSIYRLPMCEPLRVKRVADDRLTVNDGVFDFRLEGQWRSAIHETKRACQMAWIDFAHAKLRNKIPAIRATMTNAYGTWWITAPAPEPEPSTVPPAPVLE